MAFQKQSTQLGNGACQLKSGARWSAAGLAAAQAAAALQDCLAAALQDFKGSQKWRPTADLGCREDRRQNASRSIAAAAAALQGERLRGERLHATEATLARYSNLQIQASAGCQDGVSVTFYFKLNLLETECHVLDPTPVEKCTVRPQHNHTVEMDCNVIIIYNIETFREKVFVKCNSTTDSVESVQRNCPKCPILLPRNDPHVVDAVEYVLNKHNEKLSGHVYEVLEISRGQHKFEPEGFYVEFAIVQSNCTAQEAQDDHHHCHPNTAGEDHIGFCRATVFRSHASLEKPKDEEFESDCVIFDVKKGHAYSHLIKHHVGKYSTSPGDNTTVLNLAHSHNHTRASQESHSDECVVGCPVAFVKKEVPTYISDHDTPPVKGCPGRVLHFKL